MKQIDGKNVDMTDDEWKYYLELVKSFTDSKINGSLYFKNLFTTDERGYITMIAPKTNIPWMILFFIQNLMINQRLNDFEICIKRLQKIENHISNEDIKNGK